MDSRVGVKKNHFQLLDRWNRQSDALANVELNGPESLFVALNGHCQSAQQTLGGVEVHDQAIVDIDFLLALGKRIGIQGEINDHFFWSGSHAGEVCISGMSACLMDLHLNLAFSLILGHVEFLSHRKWTKQNNQ